MKQNYLMNDCKFKNWQEPLPKKICILSPAWPLLLVTSVSFLCIFLLFRWGFSRQNNSWHINDMTIQTFFHTPIKWL